MTAPDGLESWAAAVATELGLGDEALVSTATLLDVARDAAHAVTRPAAPITTFLVGWAAGTGALSLEEAVARVEGLAERWSQAAPE